MREFGVVCVRVLRHFSVFPRIHAPIFPMNYKRLQNVFNVVTNKDKIETQNALCNFSKSPHMCKLLIVWLGTLCGCAFCPYINGLRSATCACLRGWSGCLCVISLHGRLESESVSVFDGFVYL